MLKFKALLVTLIAAASLIVCVPLPLRAETPSGQVTVLTIIDVVSNYAMPHNVENSSRLLDTLAQETQNAPGLVSFKILRDATRVNHFVILGVWKDMQSFATYGAAESTKRFRQAFQPGEGGPFDERVYVDLP